VRDNGLFPKVPTRGDGHNCIITTGKKKEGERGTGEKNVEHTKESHWHCRQEMFSGRMPGPRQLHRAGLSSYERSKKLLLQKRKEEEDSFVVEPRPGKAGA